MSGSPRVVFRTDGSLAIGTGHVWRCLALAETLRRHAIDAAFICREHQGHLCDFVEQRGFAVVRLPAPRAAWVADGAHAAWLGASWREDAQETLAIIDVLEPRPEWLVVDHYGIDEEWESDVSAAGPRIMVIDDLADRRHCCDLLLDQNLHRGMDTRYLGRVPGRCELLLGPQYALVRDEFRQLRRRLMPRTGLVNRILVSLGGVDADNYTALAIDAIVRSGIERIHVDVVVGAKHPCLDGLSSACARHGFAYHVQTDRMAQLMAAADLAIGAGGSASWERCCMGLPTICIPTAANQVPIVEGLLDRGAVAVVPGSGRVEVGALSSELKALVAAPQRLARMSKVAYELVDGGGTERVCNVVGGSQ